MSAIKESAESELNFTPRRSMRATKLDISFKEADRRISLAHPDGTKRTPRRRIKNNSRDEEHEIKAEPEIKEDSSKELSNAEREHSCSEHSSGEKSKSQKRKNKKSKKQKAKANQKRKEAKKLASNSNSDEDLGKNEDMVKKEVLEENEALVENEDLVENENLVENEESAKNEDLVESGFVSASSKEVLSSFQSSDFDINKPQEIINLVSPELLLRPKMENNDTKTPEKDDASVQSIDEVAELPVETEDIVNETFEMSQTESPSEIKDDKEISQENKSRIETPKPADCVNELSRGPRHSSTPARKSVFDRKCTPFKPTNEKSLRKVMSLNMASPTPNKIAAVVLASPVVTPISRKEFTKTPLKSALRTSRRSMSVDGVDLNVTSKKGVVFNSPANTTINIEEVDWLMKSNKKIPTSVIPLSEKKLKENITVRKRRSMSLVETESEKKLLKKVAANAEDGGNSWKKQKRNPTPTSRVKLPNFNAIHKHQFERMESITDHVARKVERAKVLSGSKPKPDTVTSTAKSKDSPSNSLKKDLKRLNSASKPIPPKARQKIELSAIKVTKDVTNAAPRSVFTENLNKNVGIVRPMRKIRPMWSAVGTSREPAAQNASEKINERRKEHMIMFKQNKINHDTTVLHEERKERKEYIAGVRSNRRFILQMQHREKLKQESDE